MKRPRSRIKGVRLPIHITIDDMTFDRINTLQRVMGWGAEKVVHDAVAVLEAIFTQAPKPKPYNPRKSMRGGPPTSVGRVAEALTVDAAKRSADHE